MPFTWSAIVLPYLLVGVGAVDPVANAAAIAGTYAANVKVFVTYILTDNLPQLPSWSASLTQDAPAASAIPRTSSMW